MESPLGYDLRRMSDSVAELSEMLYGVKIEDVAQSKGYEKHQEYIHHMMATFDPNAKIEFGATGFKEMSSEQSAEMFKSPIMPIPDPPKHY